LSRLRVGVLVSGRGSNLRALIQAAAEPTYPAGIVAVGANRDCPALGIARSAGISPRVFRLADFSDREARDAAMAAALRNDDIELVVCAGYDAILAPVFTRQFAGRIINIHPSLLPAFAGTMDAIGEALAAGAIETGCTVHLVTDDVDRGPILGQRRVAVHPTDTLETLRERIQAEEYILLPEVVRRVAMQSLALRT
jgi:phosphoribosylglycinamide formyltransferase-1